MNKFMTTVGFIMMFTTVFSQYKISPDSPQCPSSNGTAYGVQYNNGSSTVILSGPGNWEITNGDIVSGNADDLAPVGVVWRDGYDHGKIVVKNSNGTQLIELVVTLFSVKHKTPSTIYGSTSVALEQQTVTYSVEKLKYSSGLNVEKYTWIIPVGWKINNQTSTGQPFTGLSNSITVTTSETAGGIIKVAAENDMCPACANSKFSQIEVQRTIPEFAVSLVPTTPMNDFVQGNTDPITFSVPFYSWATYSWSVSGGGSLVAPTNTNQVVVNPNGIGGTVSCTISAGGKTLTKSYTMVFKTEDPNNPVAISGSKTACSSGSYTYTVNNLPRNATCQWTVSSNLVKLSQTNNSVTVRGATGASSSGSINLTYKTIANVSVQKTHGIWVGKPNNLTIYGPDIILKGKVRPYTINESTIQNISTYSWSTSGGLFPNGSTTSSTFNAQGLGCGPGPIMCTASNICGSAFAFKDVDVICIKPAFAISPNPASNTLIIEQIEEESTARLASESVKYLGIESENSNLKETSYTIELWHEKLGKVKSLKTSNAKTEIDVSGLRNGTYFLHIITPTSIKKEQVIIKR